MIKPIVVDVVRVQRKGAVKGSLSKLCFDLWVTISYRRDWWPFWRVTETFFSAAEWPEELWANESGERMDRYVGCQIGTLAARYEQVLEVERAAAKTSNSN